MMSRRLGLIGAASVLGLGVAAGQAGHRQAAAPPAACGQVSEIVVTAQRLDAARATVEPALGATSSSLPEAFINNLPSGANTQLNQVILQAPGAAQDSFG